MAYCPKCKAPVLSEYSYAHICTSNSGPTWRCSKCGGEMFGPDDHSQTSGCSGGVKSVNPLEVGHVVWGSEEARRIVRYPEAVKLLRESKYLKGNALPSIWFDAVERWLASEPANEGGEG